MSSEATRLISLLNPAPSSNVQAATEPTTVEHLPTVNGPPPPYNYLETPNDDDESEEAEPVNVTKVTIDAPVKVTGKGNKVALPASPNQVSAAVLDAISKLSRPTILGGYNLDLTVNCAITVEGDDNVVSAPQPTTAPTGDAAQRTAMQRMLAARQAAGLPAVSSAVNTAPSAQTTPAASQTFPTPPATPKLPSHAPALLAAAPTPNPSRSPSHVSAELLAALEQCPSQYLDHLLNHIHAARKRGIALAKAQEGADRVDESAPLAVSGHATRSQALGKRPAPEMSADSAPGAKRVAAPSGTSTE